MTLGFDVFVHDVIEAMTIEPCFRVCSSPLNVKVELASS